MPAYSDESQWRNLECTWAAPSRRGFQSCLVAGNFERALEHARLIVERRAEFYTMEEINEMACAVATPAQAHEAQGERHSRQRDLN